MQLHHTIIHRLIKEKQTYECEVDEGQALLDSCSDVVIKLVTSIIGLFNKKENAAAYGVFKDNSTQTFPSEFDEYHQGNIDADEFTALSLRALASLSEAASRQFFATGGYLLCADYSYQDVRFFLVAMIKEHTGMAINENLQPMEQLEIDLSKLHQAARISHSKYESHIQALTESTEAGDINYLCFVSPKRNQETSGYFIDGLACAAGSTAKQATDSAIRGTEAFFAQEEGLQGARKQAKNAITEYLKERVGQGPVNLNALCNVVQAFFPPEREELGEAFLSFLNGEDYQVPPEFNVNSSVVRKHTNIKIKKERGFSLDIESRYLSTEEGATVRYDPEENTLTFRLTNEYSQLLTLADQESEQETEQV